MTSQTAKQARNTFNQRVFSRNSLTLIGMLVGWISCYVPWTATRGAAFSVNLYDLAEWTSLDSAVRYSVPPLIPTLFLRITVGLIAISLGIYAVQSASAAIRRVFVALALVIAIGLLPPLGGLNTILSDVNYRQQLGVALAAGFLILGFWLGTHRLSEQIRALSTIGFPLAALFSGIIGWLTAVNALGAFRIALTPGIGFIVFMADMIIVLLARRFVRD